ncbi:MAG: glycosyltransferase [Bacteriovorax sp.]
MHPKIISYRPVFVLAPGIIAGAEKVVLTGIVALHESGLNPLMVIIKETRAPHFATNFEMILPDYIERKMIESTRAFDIGLPYKLKNALKGEKSAIVLHSHGFKALIACWMAKGLRPHLHTHHGNTAHTFKVRIYEKIAMVMMRTCKQVIAVSDEMNKELQTLLRPYKKITTIENMLSFDNADKIRYERAHQKKLDHEVVKLIYIGRLSSEKGLLPFLECLSKIELKERFHLSVLGDGPDRPLIEKFIQENDLSSQVTMHGFVADPSLYFISPDVLVMPSLREGLPMTLIEAFASGVPIIANNVGAISSLVTHEHNGYLARDCSIESWKEVLNMTLCYCEHWKQNAILLADEQKERFSAKLWAKKTRGIYQSNLK